MEITLSFLIILSLAIFRITRLIVYDKITERLRSPFFVEVEEDDGTYLVPKGFMGNLLSCHWCVGLWVTAVLYGWYYIVPEVTGHIIVIFAAAGLASIIQVVSNRD